jgi:phage virion morphogenesis protein
MSDDFDPLTDTLNEMTGRLAPAERVKLSRSIASDLRAANARRIRANTEPGGEAMTPRKRRQVRSRRMRDQAPARSRARQERMFKGASQPRYLRRESTAGEAWVGFAGAMARIMAVHQYGEADTVTRDPGSPTVVYPVRPVLGMTADDRLRILDQVTGAIQP